MPCGNIFGRRLAGGFAERGVEKKRRRDAGATWNPIIRNEERWWPISTRPQLFVGNRAQNCDREMREERGAFIQLEPADHAVVLQVFSDAGFVDAQVLG